MKYKVLATLAVIIILVLLTALFPGLRSDSPAGDTAETVEQQ